MILKASEEARNKAAELLNAAEKGRQDTAEQIQALNEQIAITEKEMNAALQTGNVEEYQRLKSTLEAAKDIKAAHEERAEILKGKALITQEEYEELTGAILAEAEAKRIKAIKEIVNYINKAAEAGADLCEAYTDADETLHIVQHDLYRNADRPHYKAGQPVGWIGDKCIPRAAWGIVEWIQAIIDNPTYRAATGRDTRGNLNIMEFIKK